MATTTFTDNVTLVPAAWLNDVDNAAYSYLTSPAGTNTITATGPANFSYAAGAIVRWIPAGTNTGATTINITPSGASALGAKNVFYNGVACVGGETRINVPVQAMYDGTQFNLMGLNEVQNTFTASISDGSGAGLSFSSVTAYATKIGRLVTYVVSVTFPVTANGADAQINGLPYACLFETPASTLDNTGLSLSAEVITSGPATFIAIFTKGTFTKITNAQLSGKKLYFAGSYIYT